MILTQTFKINGMHCTSCAMTIDMDLEETEGVLEASTNYARQITEVKFNDEKIKPEEIISIIKKTGYDIAP